MKFFTKIIVLLCLILGNCVSAEPFKVVVLPVDLFDICDNYYCFENVSQIFAQDIIDDFNRGGKISSPDLYDVRKKLFANPSAKTVLNKYKNSNSVDFALLKQISKDFGANSVLLISSSVNKRNMWEILEISSAFELYNPYYLQTDAVLTDNVNDVIMWSGKYTKLLSDNESRFWAKSSAQANSVYEKLKNYSQEIISKNISQNVTLRFYPKVLKPIDVKTKTQSTDFRPNPLKPVEIPEEFDGPDEIESETIFNF